ncbi:hypothetical protein BXZ70DRAFT_5041 [Cristinia sonorae]|uniref:Uncharacterized protein n=1 Tax=Cristinia sonorae TaxID=1940300 RepID=A0A8K0UXW9_9AGAR|nr:hypothetical protein BXZ70DRAFT_5041 [Cristinia sonorae]
MPRARNPLPEGFEEVEDKDTYANCLICQAFYLSSQEVARRGIPTHLKTPKHIRALAKYGQPDSTSGAIAPPGPFPPSSNSTVADPDLNPDPDDFDVLPGVAQLIYTASTQSMAPSDADMNMDLPWSSDPLAFFPQDQDGQLLGVDGRPVIFSAGRSEPLEHEFNGQTMMGNLQDMDLYDHTLLAGEITSAEDMEAYYHEDNTVPDIFAEFDQMYGDDNSDSDTDSLIGDCRGGDDENENEWAPYDSKTVCAESAFNMDVVHELIFNWIDVHVGLA